MSDNTNLKNAKNKKDDEFFTLYEDIENEVMRYKEYLKGKIVYCNCDNEDSNFVKFFKNNFRELGLARLCWSGLGTNVFNYDGRMVTEEDFKISSELTEESGISKGSFDNPNCINRLMLCDIVITNPPFSLWRKYFSLLKKYNKDFLIIGNKNAITYKEVFPYFKDETLRTGYNNIKSFVNPDGTIQKFGNIGWYTTLPVDKSDKKLVLTEHYYEADGVTPKPESLIKYPHYDNYKAINCDKVKDIPCDYFPKEMIVNEKELQELINSGEYVEILEEWEE